MANKLLSDEMIADFLITFLKKSFKEDLTDIDMDTKILDLGINSIQVIDYVRQIQEEFEVMMSLQTLARDGLTIADLVEHVKQKIEMKEAHIKQQKTILSNTTQFPVLEYQRELWYYYHYSDELAASYNSCATFKLTGKVNETLFRNAINTLSLQHDFLRLSFDEAEMLETVGVDSRVKFEKIEIDVNQSDVSSAKDYVESLTAKKFNIYDQVLEIQFVSGKDAQYMVLLSHEIIFNVKNLMQIYNEIINIYNGVPTIESRSKGSSSYLDYVSKLSIIDESIAGDEIKSSLLTYLQNVSSNYYHLPTDKLRPPIKQYHGNRLSTKLGSDWGDNITSWCKQHKTTLFNYLCFNFALLTSRLTNSDTVTLGSYGDVSNLIGECCFNTQNPIAIHYSVQHDKTISENLETFSTNMAMVFDNQYYPFNRLIKELNLSRDQSRTPLFSMFFQYMELPEVNSNNDFESRMTISSVQYSKYDIVISVCKSQGEFIINCDYSTELFEQETIKNWLRLYKHMLQELSTQSTKRLSDYQCLDYHQLQQLNAWGSNVQVTAYQSVVERIDAACVATPDSVAIIEGNKKITYRELAEDVDSLAHYLVSLTQGENVAVGILLPHNTSQLISVLAVLKAGAAFVPLDIEFPLVRLSGILDDADIKIIMVDHDRQELVESSANGKVKLLNINSYSNQSTNTSLPTISSEKTAYIMYTSGSTGQPKGAIIAHSALANLTDWLTSEFNQGEYEYTLYSTSLCFDISMVEIFLPLCKSGTIIVASDLFAINELPHKDKITFINSVPSLVDALIQTCNLPEQLNLLMMIGEPLTREMANKIFAMSDSVRIINGYGPTEATVLTTQYPVVSDQQQIAIGKPLSNYDLLVLDKHQNRTPIGGLGELYIGGVGISDGYVNRPTLTDTLFKQISVGEGESKRYYQSGDMVRYMADGNLTYMGRTDTQVKISGIRIELYEIENAINSIAAVEQSVVIVNKAEDKKLYAFVIAKTGEDVNIDEKIRQSLITLLPTYMIPHRIVAVEKFPYLISGKVDRLLLEQSINSLASVKRAAIQSSELVMSSQERDVAELFKELLSLEIAVTKQDDFFDLGGNSIFVVQLIGRLRKLFGVKLGFRDFYQTSTPEGICKAIQSLIEDEKSKSLKSVQAFTDKEKVNAHFQFLETEAEIVLDDIEKKNQLNVCNEISKLFFTGSTGFVGRYVLEQLLTRTDYTVYCLTRAKNEALGVEKIIKTLKEHELWSDSFKNRIHVICGDISKPRLGLTDQDYDFIVSECDAILHNAAMVNFIYPYEALCKANVESTRQLIHMSLEKKTKTFYYVSTTAVLPLGAHFIFKETDPLHNDMSLNLGYDESKWVCEKMIRNSGEYGFPFVIFRPGEVAGHSQSGYTVTTDFMIAILAGCLRFKAFPQIECFIELTPVDYVASGLVELMKVNKSTHKTFHLSNPNPMYSKDFYSCLRSRGYEFDLLDFDSWQQKLFASPKFEENEMYAFAPALENFTGRMAEFPIYDSTQTTKLLKGTGVSCPPLDGVLMGTYMDYFNSVGFIPVSY